MDQQAQDNNRKKLGYVSIVTVVLLMLISITSIITIITVLIDQNVSYRAIVNGSIARLNADSCAEIAMNELKQDLAYTGNETFNLTRGLCRIISISGSGNENRIIDVQGEYESNIRRVRVRIDFVNPNTLIESWSEIDAF